MVVNNQKRRKKKIFFNNQKGMALITTLIFIFVLVSFSVALLIMTSNDSKLSTLHRESTRAFYLAETGVDKALWYLNTPIAQDGKGINWRTDEDDPPGPLTGGTAIEYYEVTVETDDASPEDFEIITVHSTGKVLGGGEYDKGTRIVVVKLEEGTAYSESAVYNYALMTFSEESDLEFNGHITIIGDVHSNGDITGNGFEPEDVDGSITYTGDSNLPTDGIDVKELDDIQDFPTINWKLFLAEAESAGQVYDTDTAYEIGGSEPLTGIHYFQGDVIIKNDLVVDGTIVVKGSITVSGQPDITLVNSDVNMSLVMVASGDITFGGNVDVEGIIHTEGLITLNGNITVDEGAILAEDGVINGTGAKTKIVYDVENLDHPQPMTGIPVWKIASWREVQE